ncbi:unnamed protein product, partial [Prorocentrum cordatum]
EALGKFNAAVGDLRSLTAVATTAVASAFELSERSSSAPAIGDEGMPDSAYLSSPTMAASIGGALAYKRNDDSVRSGEEAAWRVLDEAQLEGPGPQSNGGDSANSAVSLSPTPPLQPGVDDAFDGEGEDSFPVADWDHSPGQVKKWRVDQSHIHSAQTAAGSSGFESPLLSLPGFAPRKAAPQLLRELTAGLESDGASIIGQSTLSPADPAPWRHRAAEHFR